MKPVQEKEDNAVAVVIGALLTFVIVISIMGSYILWYVPSNGQSNDIKFVGQTENSLIQLQSKVQNESAFPNEFVIQSFPLGIPGTPPFSPNTDSSISFENSSGYSTHFQFSILVNVTYGTVTRTIPYNYSFNGSGQIYVDTSTPFVTPSLFYFQNDGIIVKQAGNNYSSTIGSLPLSISSGGGKGIYLNASQISINGTDTYVGGYGSTLLTLQYSNVNESDFYVGENITVQNRTGGYTSAVVNNITMPINTFYYNITSPVAQAWNESLWSTYNLSRTYAGSKSSGVSWGFTGYDLEASFRNNTLSISATQTMYPYSVNMNFFMLRLLEI